MGRLTKATTDEIERLRKEGYTQKEVAERLKVHPRTVRKYDPLRQELYNTLGLETISPTKIFAQLLKETLES